MFFFKIVIQCFVIIDHTGQKYFFVFAETIIYLVSVKTDNTAFFFFFFVCVCVCVSDK